MKTTLKRGEIIEKLKKYYEVNTLEITRQSVLDFSNFHRCYVLIVHFKNLYQIVSIHLRYGWIEIVFGDCSEVLSFAIERYIIEISSLSCNKFDEILNHGH